MECAAVAVKSELAEDEVMVCLFLKPGASLTAEQLLDYCRDKVAYFMVPRYVRFMEGLNVFWEVGINSIPVFNVENACTSGSTAFYLAYMAIAAGVIQAALVVGAEKLYVPNIGLLNSGANELDTRLGMVTPASFALRAVRHALEYGTTPEQMARVAVKNRRHAMGNPLAQFRNPITVEEVLAAPMIADPLTRLMCCPIADGAAAAVLCSPAVARN
ncbi:MAG: AMP-binding enzyme [Desulfotomaculales bacterium]